MAQEGEGKCERSFCLGFRGCMCFVCHVITRQCVFCAWRVMSREHTPYAARDRSMQRQHIRVCDGDGLSARGIFLYRASYSARHEPASVRARTRHMKEQVCKCRFQPGHCASVRRCSVKVTTDLRVLRQNERRPGALHGALTACSYR